MTEKCFGHVQVYIVERIKSSASSSLSSPSCYQPFHPHFCSRNHYHRQQQLTKCKNIATSSQGPKKPYLRLVEKKKRTQRSVEGNAADDYDDDDDDDDDDDEDEVETSKMWLYLWRQ